MTRSTRIKFRLIAQSNVKSLLPINLVLLVPTLLFLFTLMKIVPVVLGFFDTLNVSVLETSPRYDRLAIVVISEAGGGTRGSVREAVYVFDREVFRKVRKAIFLGNYDLLEQRALGFSELPLSSNSLTIRDPEGALIASLKIESVKEGAIEIIFYSSKAKVASEWLIIYAVLLLLSWIVVSGSFGGINDFTQRIVFHEPKRFGYLFHAIRRHFARSLSVSLFFCVVIGAVIANVYFYIFIVASDISVFIAAINAWMFLFFLLVLFWVYPLLVLSQEESIWKVMKKSLFVSFDNFLYTLKALGVLILLLAGSCLTLFVFPGISFCFGFINTALKEISSRYSKLDVT
ncbi:MAG TPA: hypothetical protein VMZ05_00495 [Spirochaetota bacterium]|nr:hypothetical protein [Spirochaetota bacterium]